MVTIASLDYINDFHHIHYRTLPMKIVIQIHLYYRWCYQLRKRTLFHKLISRLGDKENLLLWFFIKGSLKQGLQFQVCDTNVVRVGNNNSHSPYKCRHVDRAKKNLRSVHPVDWFVLTNSSPRKAVKLNRAIEHLHTNAYLDTEIPVSRSPCSKTRKTLLLQCI